MLQPGLQTDRSQCLALSVWPSFAMVSFAGIPSLLYVICLDHGNVEFVMNIHSPPLK